MKATDFAGATGYLRAMEKKILTTSGIDRVIETSSSDETLRMLSQSSDLDFTALRRAEDYESVLSSELKRVYDLMIEICPQPEITAILAAKYDYHNVKVLVKSHFLKIDSSDMLIVVTDTQPKMIAGLLNGSDSGDLPLHIADATLAAKEVFERAKDPQQIDLELDKLCFEYMLSLCEQVDNEFITSYVKMQIDFFNAKTMLRVKNMDKGLYFLQSALADGGSTDKQQFIDCYDKPIESMGDNFTYNYFGDLMRETIEVYAKTGTYAAMEKLTDNHLINAIKETKMVPYGPEPLFAYVVAKENELKQVRILITCKANKTTTETLRERLRDNYA